MVAADDDTGPVLDEIKDPMNYVREVELRRRVISLCRKIFFYMSIAIFIMTCRNAYVLFMTQRPHVLYVQTVDGAVHEVENYEQGKVPLSRMPKLTAAPQPQK